jgi:dTDP-glucose 4,6-dehydratase
MKLLVTGGAGFIGSNFSRLAVGGEFDNIDSLVVLDNLTYAGNISNLDQIRNDIQFVQGDIRDSDLISKLVLAADVIVNFAAESHVDRSIQNPRVFLETNVIGVQVILDAVRSSGQKKFLQVSTDEVYGSIPEGSWTESAPLLPNSPYSATKASADLLVRSYCKTYGVDAVITRCSNNYGPYQFTEKLIPLFLTRLIQRKKVGLYGDGSNRRDWLHVDDHCRGIFSAITNGVSGEIYNLGGGDEMSNREITNLLLEITGSSPDLVEFIEDRPGHDFRYSVDWSKAKQSLGYQPRVEFREGLKATYDWYLSNSKWWKKN